VKTAAELKKQTDQMGKVIDDLNEIEFSMQRASKVIRDITRGLATDKCAPQHHAVAVPPDVQSRLQVQHCQGACYHAHEDKCHC
jgi:hypothetical protein